MSNLMNLRRFVSPEIIFGNGVYSMPSLITGLETGITYEINNPFSALTQTSNVFKNRLDENKYIINLSVEGITG